MKRFALLVSCLFYEQLGRVLVWSQSVVDSFGSIAYFVSSSGLVESHVVCQEL